MFLLSPFSSLTGRGERVRSTRSPMKIQVIGFDRFHPLDILTLRFGFRIQAGLGPQRVEIDHGIRVGGTVDGKCGNRRSEAFGDRC